MFCWQEVGARSFEAKLFGPILVRQRSEDVRQEEDGEWENIMEPGCKNLWRLSVPKVLLDTILWGFVTLL